MKRAAGVICAFVVLLSLGAAVRAQTDMSQKREEQPAVVKAVAPSAYPWIAVAARSEGQVVIEVKIDERGEVTSVKGAEGPALLRAVSSIAAKRWRFAPAAGEVKERSARLTFIFRLLSDKEQAQQETSFNPPFQIIYAVVPPKTLDQVNY